MRHLNTLLAWIVAAVIVALAALNWHTLMASASLDLVVARIDAPLGVVLLGLAGVLAALIFVAYLRNQVRTLMETKKLLQDVQRFQDLADRAEASRIEGLRQLITAEFRQLDERLGAVNARSPGSLAGPSDNGFRPVAVR